MIHSVPPVPRLSYLVIMSSGLGFTLTKAKTMSRMMKMFLHSLSASAFGVDVGSRRKIISNLGG